MQATYASIGIKQLIHLATYAGTGIIELYTKEFMQATYVCTGI